MKHLLRMKQGFTLIEILTAVIIVAILVVMAVPLYEKTIERSHLAEAQTVLAKLQEAKIQAMDEMGCTNYTLANVQAGICPGIAHLNTAFTPDSMGWTATTKDFVYSLYSPTDPNAVCAKRLTGEYKNTLFFYRGSIVDGTGVTISCKGPNCNAYGLDNTDFNCTFPN